MVSSMDWGHRSDDAVPVVFSLHSLPEMEINTRRGHLGLVYLVL